MRLGPLAWLLPCMLLACGGRTSDPASGGDGQSTGGSRGATTNSDAIVGQVFVATGGQPYGRFDANLQPFTPTTSACERATRTVGSCCSLAPVMAGYIGPGSGTPATEVSAGTLQLLDGTSHATLGTYDYSNGQYANLPASFYSGGWKAGDELTVTATGGDIGAFQVTGPALTPPTDALQTAVMTGQDLKITWATDPYSQTMSIGMLDATGAQIVCTVPEAQQSVTIDASLLSALGTSSSCQGTASREAVRETTVATGRVQFVTIGWVSGQCPAGW